MQILPIKNDIIEINNIKYIVFSADKLIMKCYVISTEKDETKDFIRIVINKTQYFVYYNEMYVFSLKKNCKIVDLALDNDISRIELLINEKKFPKIVSKDNVEENEKENKMQLYKAGTLFKCKDKTIVYLFSFKGLLHFVDVEDYKKCNKTITFTQISPKRVEGDIDLKKQYKIVKELYKNKVDPYEQIEKLYCQLSKYYE